jgi:hypothetical protein
VSLNPRRSAAISDASVGFLALAVMGLAMAVDLSGAGCAVTVLALQSPGTSVGTTGGQPAVDMGTVLQRGFET